MTSEQLALAVLRRAVAAIGGSERSGQVAMCTAAVRSLSDGELHLAQAGTGTGKSLAYLAAAFSLVQETGERAIISTATLALQQQVMGKDAPLVADAIEAETGTRPEVAVLKGWQNYVCPHKIAGGYPVDEAPSLFQAGDRQNSPAVGSLGEQVLRLREWAAETTTGDRDELVPGVSDRAWRQASVSKLECLGSKCPVRAECFAEKARAVAHKAAVVVTNHAILGVAASGSPGVLPEHSFLVIDEAHDLQGRVTSAASAELSGATVDRISKGVGKYAASVHPRMQAATAAFRAALDALPAGRLSEAPAALADAAIVLGAAAREGSSGITTGSDDDSGARAVTKSDLVVLAEICDRITSGSIGEHRDVAWVDRGREGQDPPRLNLAPLDVAGSISLNLLAERGVLATSATLQLGASFEPIARAIGADSWSSADYGSPFDYGAQGILYVAAHLPRPGREGVSDDALEELAELVVASRGGTLGLFSSLRGAQRAAEFVRERVDTPVLLQGEETLGQLVKEFAANREASLFGTLSLWQGVDVPGDTCRLVVIDRIPFPRPDDPIMAARTEVAEAAGRSGFMEVSVTHAALLLSQGVGRLIRSDADRGVVAILDSRIANAGYGRFLTNSLPEFWRTKNREQVLSSLQALAVKEIAVR